MEGWIKLHRKIVDNDVFKSLNSKQRDVMMMCLILASHKEKEWYWNGKFYKIKPGQFVTSLDSIRRYCSKDVTNRTIRTTLEILEKAGFLTNESTNRGRLITICNWEKYQSKEDESDKQNENHNGRQTDRQTDNQTVTYQEERNKEYKNNNNYILKDIVCDTAEVSPTPSDKIVALKNKNPNTPYSQIVELYNDTCGAAFGMVTSLSIQRKKHLKILFRDLNHDLDTIRHLFIKAKESDFLRGHNKRSWRATFDWLIKINNAVKVLDGNYDNKHTGGELEAVFARFLAKEN